MRTAVAMAIGAIFAQTSPSAAQSLPSSSPLIGYWTGSKVLACDRSNDSLIIIESNSYKPHESTCEFRNLRQSNDRFAADLACWTEGEQMYSTVAARLLDTNTALIGDEYANLMTTGVEYFRCTPTDVSTKIADEVYPEVVEDAQKAVREAYNAYQVIEYCEKAGFDNYGYADDPELQGAIRRIERLTGENSDALERIWSDVRGLVTTSIEREASSRMAGTCSLTPNRVARIVSIADALDNYKPELAKDVMPSTSRPF